MTYRFRINNAIGSVVQSRINLVLLLAASSIILAGCASSSSSLSSSSSKSDVASAGRYKVGKSYSINGKTYYPQEVYSGTQTGVASWYGPGFHGKRTANGEVFDENALTAAHPTLQMPSLVRVTNLQNNRSIIVRVNDRGPFHSNRVMDLSKAGAEALGFRNMGTAQVQLDILTNESMVLAEAAKRKIDTRGAEIAMNQTGQLDGRFAAFYPTVVAQPQDTTMLAMAGQNPVVNGSTYQPQVPPETALIAAPLGVEPMQVASYQPIQTIDQDAPIQDIIPGQMPVSQQLVAREISPAVAEAVLPPLNTGAIVPAAKPMPPQHMQVERVALNIPSNIPVPQPAPQAYQMAPVTEAGVPVPPPAPRGLLGRISIGGNAAHAADAAPAQAGVGNNYVQVGAYLSRASAQVLSDELSAYGPATVIPARPNDTSYYRVRIGPFQTADAADDVVDALKSQGRMAMVLK